jgi:anti-sigma factor RsiW
MSAAWPDETVIGAFLDGELSPEERAAVERAIADHAELAQHVARLRADQAALSRSCAGLAPGPIPRRLIEAARHPPVPASARLRRRRLLWAGGGAVAVAAGLGAVLLTPGGTGDPLVRQALAARSTLPGGAHRLEEPSIGAADAALGAHFGRRVRIPDLAPEGYRLAALALWGNGDRRAAQARYEAPDRPPFTIYLASPRGRDAFALEERPSLRICVWENTDLATVMAADLSRAALFRLASLAYVAMTT